MSVAYAETHQPPQHRLGTDQFFLLASGASGKRCRVEAAFEEAGEALLALYTLKQRRHQLLQLAHQQHVLKRSFCLVDQQLLQARFVVFDQRGRGPFTQLLVVLRTHGGLALGSFG